MESPTISFNSIKEEVKLRIGDFDITPIKVKHAHDAMGFIIEKDQVAILFTLDTRGPQIAFGRSLARLKI